MDDLIELTDDQLEAHYLAIRQFIYEQYENSGANVAVMGLSGGIDSTLTATIATRVLGPENMYGLIMPSEVNESDNMSDAQELAEETLGIEYNRVAVEPIVKSFLSEFPRVGPEYIGNEDYRIPIGNLRVRIRALMDYFAANVRDGIVLGTGNRSETLVGYYTKYGDGAVDCHPIGNLYKTQVRQLARYLGVDEKLVEKPPTAGMWEGQEDEDELGISYEDLDKVLYLTVEKGIDPETTASKIDGISRSDVDKVLKFYNDSEHKRQFPPAPPSL